MSTQHTTDITTLKKLAHAATQGKWIRLNNVPCSKDVSITTKNRKGCQVPICELDTHYSGRIGKEQKANAAYLAKASPAVMLALIARLEQAEQQRDELQAELLSLVRDIQCSSARQFITTERLKKAEAIAKAQEVQL